MAKAEGLRNRAGTPLSSSIIGNIFTRQFSGISGKRSLSRRTTLHDMANAKN
jgi:hypothetical protein